MPFPASLVGSPLGRSYICLDYELRVTQRCLEEDLGFSADTDFEVLRERGTPEIITAFIDKRCDNPTDRSEIAPLTCGRTVYRLGYGHDHRGGTWHDQENEVVWLLAYHRHRSGDPEDAFPYIKGLDEDDRLLPDACDYKALYDDRDQRAAEVAPAEAQELLAEAREQQGTEVCGVLGARAGVGVAVTIVETLEETAIALDTVTVPAAWVQVIPAWFFPESSFEEWDWTGDFPTRPLRPGEICARHIRET